MKVNCLPYLLFASGLLVFLLAFLAQFTRIKNTQVVSQPSPTPEIKLPGVNNQENRPDASMISLKVGDKEIFKGFIGSLTFWKGYAFTSDYEVVKSFSTEDSLAKIVKFDLQTGEKSVVLALDNVENPMKGNDPRQIGESSISVVEDKLIIILSGYMQSSRVFWFSSPTSSAKELKDLESAMRIEKLGNQYYITGGFGDGCGGSSSYILFNPNTLQSRFIVTSYLGCADGEEVIGNYNGQFILSNHQSDNMGEQKYKNLTLINATNPSIRKTLLSEAQMPQNVRGVTFNESKKNVEIYANDRYVYDLPTGEMKIVTQIPDIFKDAWVFASNDEFICVMHSSGTQNGTSIARSYKIAKSDGSYAEDEAGCTAIRESKMTTIDNNADEIRKYLKTLNLPSTVTVTLDGELLF